MSRVHLGDEDEDHEEEGGDGPGDAAVLEALLLGVALLPQRVLHDPVPVVSCSKDAKECRCRHQCQFS